MLVFDFYTIGNKLLLARKRLGLTQTKVADAAGLSMRTYADIERGTVNMRTETLLRICDALMVTPNNILTEDNHSSIVQQEELLRKLDICSSKERETALRLLGVYLDSIDKNPTNI